jgi:UDP-N-acetylglucosamine acyltransferase
VASRIHATAIVDARAELGRDVRVGPYSIVGPGAIIGDECVLDAHVVISGPSQIGRRNVFHPFAVVGAAAQDKRRQTSDGRLVIGDDNVIREHVTMHRGTDGRETRVGSNSLFMVGSHVAHDVVVGSWVTLANGVQLAGHVRVGDHVTFGGLAAVGQRAHVGDIAFVAGGAMVEHDVPPFVIVQGDRARVRALNKVGLARSDVPEESQRALERAFRAVYARKEPIAGALAKLDQSDPYVAKFAAALQPQLARRRGLPPR